MDKKLDWDDVEEIREEYKGRGILPTQKQLAKKYGISEPHVSHVVANNSWFDPSYDPPNPKRGPKPKNKIVPKHAQSDEVEDLTTFVDLLDEVTPLEEERLKKRLEKLNNEIFNLIQNRNDIRRVLVIIDADEDYRLKMQEEDRHPEK